MSPNPTRPGPAGGRIETIEMGRGIAAIAVVVFHANAAFREFGGRFYEFLSIGEHGVDFFFVLSGFIIFSAHWNDIGRPAQATDYYLKRLIRLVPLLWLVVLGWAALRHATGQPDDWSKVLNSLFLWPSAAPTTPSVVWTLRHEALFYLIFGVLVIHAWTGRVLFLAWGIAVVAQALALFGGAPLQGPMAMVLSSFTLDFFMGAGVAALYRHGRLPFGPPLLAAGLLALAAALGAGLALGYHRESVTDFVSPVARLWVPVLGLCFALVVAGLAATDRVVRVPRWAVLLGGASYAVYLVHLPVISVAQRVAAKFPHALVALGAGHVFVSICGIAAGVAVHIAIEKPAIRWLRRRLLKRPTPAMAA